MGDFKYYMLSMEERKTLVKMALTCFRPPGEKYKNDPRFLPEKQALTAEEIKMIGRAVDTGEISDEFLDKHCRDAHEGSKVYGVLAYFFGKHNEDLQHGEKASYEKTRMVGFLEYCKTCVAEIVGNDSERKNNNWIVERKTDGKRFYSDSEGFPGIFSEKHLNVGDKVAFHRYKIGTLLSEEQVKKYS